MNKTVFTLSWQHAPYKKAWDLQERILTYNLKVKQLNKTNNSQIPTLNVFLFCEHPPVYTLGKSGEMKNLLLNTDALNAQGIEFYKINRGGDITYHGPGQITGYPIIDLENFQPSVAWFIQAMEQFIINTLKTFGIVATPYISYTGVWLDVGKENERKICAIGVKMSRFVSIHGFALNVNTVLDFYKNIIPCGIDDKAVTSMKHELQKAIDLNEVIQELTLQFKQVFDAQTQEISMKELEHKLNAYAT